jgi:hypothetical protein
VTATTGKMPLALPLAFTCGLSALALLPRVRDDSAVLLAFLGAALVLLAWTAALAIGARGTPPGRRRSLALEVVLLNQH